MASNKPKRGLDKSTGAAVSDLDAFLATLTDAVIEPHEWTVEMAFKRATEKGSTITRNGIESKLRNDERNGILKSRKVLIGGKWANAYSAK